MSMIDDRDRPAGAQGRGANNSIDDDPLAELIRIVKEEDPFGDVLAWQPAKDDDAAVEQEATDMSAEEAAAQPEAAAPPQPQRRQEHAPEQPRAEAREQTHARHTEPAEPPVRQQQPEHGQDEQHADTRGARRRGPPPLEPIALEEALREFREAPESDYEPPRDEYDPAAVPGDDFGPATAEPVEEAPAYTHAPRAEHVEHVPYHDDPPEQQPTEAYYGDVIEGEDEDSYQDRAFADIGTDDYSDDEDPYVAPAHAAYTPAPQAPAEPHGEAVFMAAAAEQQQPARGRRGLFFGAGVLLGLAVLAGLFVTLFQSGGDAGADGPLPVIQASDGPAKIAPEDPGGANIPNQERLVYNRVSGEEAEPDTRLVSREEEVMAQVGDKAPDRFPGLGGDTNKGEAIGKDKPEAIPAAAAPEQSTSLTPQPRRVRTLVVGPDGSLSAAPQEEAPAPAPPIRTVSAEPQQEADAQPAARAEEPAPRQAAPQDAAPETPSRSSVTPTRPAQEDTPSVQPIRQANAQEPVRRAQTPGRPLALNPNPVSAAQARESQPAAPAQAPQQVAAAAPATSTPPAVASQGDYVVQLAARKSEEQARGAYNSLQSQYSGLLGRYQPLIQRADLGDRGVYYRVRVGPMASSDSASQLCNQLKAAGLSDCLVRRR